MATDPTEPGVTPPATTPSVVPPATATEPPAVKEDSAAVSQAILGRQILTGLAIASFALAVVLLVVGTFWSGTINSPVSRACLITLASLAVTTFAWVFYPHTVSAQRVTVPFLDWQVTGFGGPLLLLILTLSVLHFFFPKVQPAPTPATRYYVLNDPVETPASAFRYNGVAAHPRLIPVKDPNRPNLLAGFVAKFDTADPFTVTLTSQLQSFNPQTVTFELHPTNGPDVNVSK